MAISVFKLPRVNGRTIRCFEFKNLTTAHRIPLRDSIDLSAAARKLGVSEESLTTTGIIIGQELDMDALRQECRRTDSILRKIALRKGEPSDPEDLPNILAARIAVEDRVLRFNEYLAAGSIVEACDALRLEGAARKEQAIWLVGQITSGNHDLYEGLVHAVADALYPTDFTARKIFKADTLPDY